MAVCQFQQGHAGFIALLLHLVCGEKEPCHSSGVLADLLCPAEKTLAIPLQLCLVVRWHMLLHRAVLVGTAVKPQMGDDTGTGKEDFHRGPGKAYIYRLFDVLIRHRVVHALHTDMVIVLDSVHPPNNQLKRGCRQRLQEELLLGKTGCPAASCLWKGLWLNASNFSWTASFSSKRDRNWWLRKAARTQVEATPT